MRTNVIAKLELEGLHNWPDAKKVFPEVAFLSDIHRHKWYITAKKKVNHDDRDIEFIMFKRDIEEYLRSKYLPSSTPIVIKTQLDFPRLNFLNCATIPLNQILSPSFSIPILGRKLYPSHQPVLVN